MPATENTWYNQRLLHVAFGCTGLMLLASTFWMFAADHNREWKGYQRTMRDVDLTQLSWRLQAELETQRDVVEQLEQELAAAQAVAPPAEVIDWFQAITEKIGDLSFEASRSAYEEFASQAPVVEQANEAVAKSQAALTAAEAALAAADDAGREVAQSSLSQARTQLADDQEALQQALAVAARLRDSFLGRLQRIEKRAKFARDEAVGTRKLVAAEFGAVTARQDLMVRDGDFAGSEQLQGEVDEQKAELDRSTLAQQTAIANHDEVRRLLGIITGPVDSKQKELVTARSEESRLATSLDEGEVTFLTSSFPFVGKKLLTLPILEAFNSPLKIDNRWTEGLTMPVGSFGEVRRFDRCTTCHRGIEKTAPGSAVEPAYEVRHRVTLQLPTPSSRPEPGQTLQDVYGISLAESGLVERDEVTVELSAPRSLAAAAVNTTDSACAGGLLAGDVIRYVGNDQVYTSADVVQFLLLDVQKWGAPLELVVDRGLPQPYTSHPRLDLYVGSLSPHKATVMGCTVCHEGQGSGTSFNYASHTPNSLAQEEEWRRKYGWFDNHHWIFPMQPARFAESTCLKCHHDVMELGPSERFREAPAPQLFAGYNLAKAYGCYGCHEIGGYKGPGERIGPDLRLEPNYFAAAAQMSHDPTFQTLPLDQQALAHHLVQHPEDDRVRHELLAIIEADAALPEEDKGLSPEVHKLAAVLGDIETPGQEAKAGPSLRYVANKVGETFLYDWIREPKHFRPSTKMPQFFGQWDHLQDDPESLQLAQTMEPVEILGIVTYLLNKSQPMEFVTAAEGCLPPDAERGKLAFETRGCIACHQHSAYDDVDYGRIEASPRLGVSRQEQGPNLSNVGDKFKLQDNPDPHSWLYTWLRNPRLYHPRTKMPNVYLEPQTDAAGQRVDPAADIAAFLLSSTNDWAPADVKLAVDEAALQQLALEHLSKTFFTEQATQYLRDGIPESMKPSLKGFEAELVNVDGSLGDLRKKKLLYVGGKTIVKYGCYGCHDIPGFEAAKTIGTSLADWGRKDPSKIAFEHIAEYISHGHGHASGAHADGGHDAGMHEGGMHEAGVHDEDVYQEAMDDSFYMHRLEANDRTGFIWQKLKEPRSYDFKKTRNKEYNDRLRMPKFPLTDAQREQVITFVLGLVAEPPAYQFVYHPDARQEAINLGQKVLDKYNCAGCHILEIEKWDIEYTAGQFSDPLVDETAYPFTNAQLPSTELAASTEPDKQRGTLRAVLEGVPEIAEATAREVLLEFDSVDEEWYPLDDNSTYDAKAGGRSFTLWRPTAVEGQIREVGDRLTVPASAVRQRHLAHGGDLTFKLLPRVLEIEREVNSAAKGTETWGWLPPALHDEGMKVQPEWLHNFLLDPQPIRPASFLRMPNFHMSPAEATALVNYFAAKDNVDYPYDYVERTRGGHLAQLEAEYVAQPDVKEPESTGVARLEDALKIVTYKDYCVSCHQVADYQPAGAIRAKAPNLANAYKRLRGDYLRNWIAKPARILPYTPMPVVIPYTGEPEQLVSQSLYHGTPVQQLDAVVDLLMNFDRYTEARTAIAPLVAPATTTAGAPAEGDQASLP